MIVHKEIRCELPDEEDHAAVEFMGSQEKSLYVLENITAG